MNANWIEGYCPACDAPLRCLTDPDLPPLGKGGYWVACVECGHREPRLPWDQSTAPWVEEEDSYDEDSLP